MCIKVLLIFMSMQTCENYTQENHQSVLKHYEFIQDCISEAVIKTFIQNEAKRDDEYHGEFYGFSLCKEVCSDKKEVYFEQSVGL